MPISGLFSCANVDWFQAFWDEYLKKYSIGADHFVSYINFGFIQILNFACCLVPVGATVLGVHLCNTIETLQARKKSETNPKTRQIKGQSNKNSKARKNFANNKQE